MAIIAEFVVYVFMEFVFYSIGRLLIPLISFGQARAQTFKEMKTSYVRMYSVEDDKVVFTQMATSMIGVLTLFALITLLIYFKP
jgi:hypothetical protein